MEFLPDGRFVVADQWNARIHLVSGDSAWVVATIPDVTFNYERGLVGLAVDPEWPTRPYIYAHVTRVGYAIHIIRLEATGVLNDPDVPFTLTNEYVIINDAPDAKLNHNGGTLEFGPDSMLYVSLGEDGVPCAAQDSTTLTGVILRLDVSGLPAGAGGPPSKALITPSDNPHVSSPDANTKLVFCHGLRNPWRFTIDPATGKVYIGDVGEVDWEEIDEAVGGENFGWPYREGPANYVPSGCSEPGGVGASSYDTPIYSYNRSLMSGAINGGVVYHTQGGDLDLPAEYDGVLFFNDYLNNWIRVLEPDGPNWALKDSIPGQPTAENWAEHLWFISDWEVGPDGGLYFIQQYNGSFQGSPGDIRRMFFSDSPGSVPVETAGPLLQAYPNPATGSSSVRVELSGARGTCRVDVFSVTGRKIRSLNTITLEEGQTGEFTWDRTDNQGRRVPSGVYFLSTRFLSGGPAEPVPARRIVLFP